MSRREDWPIRLNACVEAARGRPFSWGEHDCCLWAAGVVRELTGLDWAAAFRGQYASAMTAQRVLDAAGGVEAIATRALGAPVAAAMARRGDVVLIETAGRTALGVCVGERAAAAGMEGIVLVPPGQWLKAWHV